MRILPASQRDAMYQVYAFCRAVDDIADSALPRAERAAGLDRWRTGFARNGNDGGGFHRCLHGLACRHLRR